MPLACPRCGGLVGIETSPDGQAAEIVSIVPIGPGVENEVRHLPDDVGAYYRDAIRVMQVGVPDAAAVQLRRTLEAAAAYFEDREGNRITGGTLNQQIERLLGAGLITGPIHGAVHHVRMLGNIGAHATDERLDDERVRRALMFTTQLLRNLFEIPGELKAIQGASEDTPK
jgi:hypothetical protein